MAYLFFFGVPILAAFIAYGALLPFYRRFHSNGMKGRLVIEPGDIAIRLFQIAAAATLLWVWNEAF